MAGWPILQQMTWSVTLGEGGGTAGGPGVEAGGNFALILTEDDDPVPVRYTTWGLSAQAAIALQSQATGTQIVLGANGFLYELTPDSLTDDGTAITLTMETGILPLVDTSLKQHELFTEKILRVVEWTVSSPPAESTAVTITAIDAEDATNTVVRTVSQSDQHMSVQIGLRARRWIIRFEVQTTQPYSLVEFHNHFIVKAKARVGDSQ